MKQIKSKLLLSTLLISTINLNQAHAQEAFLGGPPAKRQSPHRNPAYDTEKPLPSYMPKRHPSWEGMRVKSKVVRKYQEPISNVGFAVGREPSKSIGKQIHPIPKRRGRSGFGSVGMF